MKEQVVTSPVIEGTRIHAAGSERITPTLASALNGVEEKLKRLDSLLSSGVMPMFIAERVGVSRKVVQKIERTLRENELIVFDRFDKRGVKYSEDGVLAIAAVCWKIAEKFNQSHPLDESWKSIIKDTKAALGNSTVAESLREPETDDLRFSSGKTTRQDFISGRGGPMASEALSRREQIEELRSWDINRLRDLYELIPVSILSADFSSSTGSENVAKTIMKISAAIKGRPFLLDLDVDSLSCVEYKKAIGDCVVKLEILKNNSNINNLWMLNLATVRREDRD